ncbi:hypothetical protein K1T71_001736 [Dendrolimus kikuchii]|uniref:Uncharacterized protein n=1 Tax=Dendrolimus kikuchii TaxID=765133 RepID=A0ACC1DFH2_9NEOP|nr:hypothetical protein K1T71_001736 [Dendrolimus kikuchii]
MCKNVVLVPMKKTVDSAMQKTCRPALFGRVWQASRRALSLEYSPPKQFACSQWQTGPKPSTFYLIYRWLLFITVVIVGVISFICQYLPKNYHGPEIELNYFKWFIYLTNWGYAMIIIQTGLALAVVHKYRNETKCNLSLDEEEHPMSSSKRTRTPLVCRAYWLTQNIATDLAFVITLVYWSLVYDPKMHTPNPVNLLVHGSNSLVMICELCVTAHPVRMAHALYGAGMGLTYGMFSYLYWAAGGTDRIGLPAIYPALDWNKPGAAIVFVSVCAVVLIFAHAFSTAVAAMRLCFNIRSFATKIVINTCKHINLSDV